MLRVTQFCQVNSEDEARAKLKKLISLRVAMSLADRRDTPVGNLAEITTKAKQIADEDLDGVTEEEEGSYNGDEGIESVAGEIEPTEDGGAAPLQIEEAKNFGSASREQSQIIEEESKGGAIPVATTTPAASEPIVEDLTNPGTIVRVDEIGDWEERFELAQYTDCLLYTSPSPRD